MAIVHFRDYATFKNTLDRRMAETANNFVMIGYLLKEARDTNILADSGYSSMGEFAKAEYGLDDSHTSRFISICERYGNGEDRLLPQFERYGYTKLSEMLTLPESVTEVLSPDMTKDEIREIKAEIKQEEEISDIEVCMEEKPETDNLLIEALKAYFHEYPEEFRKVFNTTGNWKKLIEAIAPNESVTLMMRVPGVGRLMIRIESYDAPVKLVNIRENTTKEYSVSEFTAAVDAALDVVAEDPEKAWKEIYGEEMPKEPEKPKEVKPVSKPKKNVKIAPAQKTKKEKPELDLGINKPEATVESAEKEQKAQGQIPEAIEKKPQLATETDEKEPQPIAEIAENAPQPAAGQLKKAAKALIEEVITKMCEEYCKYPYDWDEDKEGIPLSESSICVKCPLKRLEEEL